MSTFILFTYWRKDQKYVYESCVYAFFISVKQNFIALLFYIGSGLLEFGEFCQLAAKFLVEEDEEGLKKELKEAFRIYDKEGNIAVSYKFCPI